MTWVPVIVLALSEARKAATFAVSVVVGETCSMVELARNWEASTSLTLIARAGTRAVVGAVLLVVMTTVLQSLLAGLADDHVIFGALHATDGLLILAIPAYLYVWTGRKTA